MIALLRAALFSLVVLANLAAGAAAADYPNRPVRWLIGFSAGGPVGIVARS
jgi:tripartite-type tricarboxylate transporter receptor subunit TctC